MNGSQSKKPEKQVIKKMDIDEEQVFKDEVIPKISSLDANLYDKYPIEDIDKLDNVTKTKFLLDILYSPSKEITVKQVENESKKYFTNYQIVKKDIKDGEVVAYKYENNKYIKGTTVGNRCTLKTSITSKKKVDSNYIVKSKYYYISGKKNSVEDLDATIKIFKSLEDCKQDKSEIFTTTSKTIGITEEDLDQANSILTQMKDRMFGDNFPTAKQPPNKPKNKDLIY